MLRRSIVVGAAALVLSGGAFAQACTCAGGTRMNQTQLAAALVGKTICAVAGSDRWQEFHSGSGTTGPLIELGNTVGGLTVGTWTIDGTGGGTTMRYVYGAGGSGGTYSYEVCQQGSLVHFCSALRNITNVSVVASNGPCGTGFTRP